MKITYIYDSDIDLAILNAIDSSKNIFNIIVKYKKFLKGINETTVSKQDKEALKKDFMTHILKRLRKIATENNIILN